MNDQMYEELLDISSKRKMVSIYSNIEETENFCVGFIIGINEDDMVMQHIAPNGFYDGYILIKANKIYRIECDGLYQAKINKLYSTKTRKHDNIILSGKNLVVSLLELAKENNYIVSLILYDSGLKDIQGFVLNIDELNANISLITQYGANDGISNVDTGCITRIECDTDEEQLLKILADKQC